MSYSINYQWPPVQFISEQLPQLLDDVPFTMQTWVLHDVAPVHSSHNIMQYLDNHYPG
jgi:hypothetical protein